MGVGYAQRGVQVREVWYKRVAAQEAEMGGMDGHDVDPGWNGNPKGGTSNRWSKVKGGVRMEGGRGVEQIEAQHLRAGRNKKVRRSIWLNV